MLVQRKVKEQQQQWWKPKTEMPYTFNVHVCVCVCVCVGQCASYPEDRVIIHDVLATHIQ